MANISVNDEDLQNVGVKPIPPEETAPSSPVKTPTWDNFVADKGPQKDAKSYDNLKTEYFAKYIVPSINAVDIPEAHKYFMEKAKIPEQPGFLKGVAEAGYQGVKHAFATRGRGYLGVAAGGATGPQKEELNNLLRKGNRQVQESTSPYADWDNVHGVGDAVKWGANALGETAGFIAPEAGLSLATGGASLLPSVAAISLGNAYADQLERADKATAQRQFDKNEPLDLSKSSDLIDKDKAVAGAALSTALEVGGLHFLPKRVKDALSGVITKEAPTSLLKGASPGGVRGALKEGGKAALGEGVTEALQTYPEAYAGNDPRAQDGSMGITDPTLAREAAKSGLTAAFGGGVLGASVGAIPGSRTPSNSPEEQTNEDDIAGMRGEPEAPPILALPAPLPKSDEEIKNAERESKLNEVKGVQKIAPTAFTPAPPKKGKPVNPDALLTYPEFEKDAKAAWKETIPKLDEVQLNEEYSKALESDPTLDHRAFVKARTQQEQEAHKQTNPEPSLQNIRSAYVKYRALHSAGIRSFDDAYQTIENQYGVPKEEKAPEGKGQLDMFGAPPVINMSGEIQEEPKASPEPVDPRQQKLPLIYPENALLPAPLSAKLREQADAMESGDLGPVHPEAVATLRNAADRYDAETERMNAQKPPEAQPKAAPNMGDFIERALKKTAAYRKGDRAKAVAGMKNGLEALQSEDVNPGEVIAALREGVDKSSASDSTKKLRYDFLDHLESFLPTQEITNENPQEQNEGRNEGNPSNGAQGEETGIMGEEGKPETLYAAQGQEVENAQQVAEASQGVQQSGLQVGNSQEETVTPQEVSDAPYSTGQAQENVLGSLGEVQATPGGERGSVAVSGVSGGKSSDRRDGGNAELVSSGGGEESNGGVDRPPLDTSYLKDPVAIAAMESFAKDAGWQEVGGKLIRDTNGVAVGRTKWLPKADWFFNRPEKTTEKDFAETIRRLKAGEKLSPKQLDVAEFLHSLSTEESEFGRDRNFDFSPEETEALKDEVWGEAEAAAKKYGVDAIAKVMKEAEVQSEGRDPYSYYLSVRYGLQNLGETKKPRAEEAPRQTESGERSQADSGTSSDVNGEPGENGGRGEEPKYSTGSGSESGTTRKALESVIGKSPRAQIHATVADAEKATGRKLKSNAKAFVVNGKAHFIAANISSGSELGVFLHEVGAHLGMEKILSKEQMQRLAETISKWAQGPEGATKDAATEALRKSEGDPAETIAYFIEEAVNQGINPTATNIKTPVGRLMHQVWTAIKNALVKFGLKDVGQMTPKDIVDFAHAAAKTELKSEETSSGKDIQYSLKEDAKAAAVAAKNWTKDVFTDSIPAHAKLLLNPHQVAELNPQFPSAGHYADAVDAMQAEAMKNQQHIGTLVERMNALDKEDLNKLSDLMTKATLTGIHPDLAFDDSRNAHLETAKNDDQVHKELQRRFEKELSPAAKKIFVEMRDHFATMWDTRIKAVKDLAERVGLKDAELAKIKKDMDSLAKKIKGPYFPLMREGKYVVVWKSPALIAAEKEKDQSAIDKLKESSADYWVRFTDSESEAKSLEANRPEKIMEGSHGEYKLRTEASREVSGAGAEFMSKLESALADRIKDKEAKEVAIASLRQVFMETLPDISVMRRTMMRRGVAGVRPEDMLRAISKAGMADAHYLARLTHADQVTTALQNLRLEDANPAPGESVNKGQIGMPQGGVGKIYSIISKSYKGDMMRPANEGLDAAASRLLEVSYLHSLAADTGNLIANTLQPALTVFPMLHARFGTSVASREMGRGLTDALKVARFSDYELDIDKIADTNGEREALRKLRDMGVVELSMARDMASIGRGVNLTYDKMRRIISLPAHYIETLTRIGSALAAYRLELARANRDETGKSLEERKMKAIRYAAQVSRTALVDFSPGGSPIVMKGNKQALAKLGMQYKRFAISMLYLYGKTARDAIKSSNLEQKKEAQKTLAALTFMQFTIAGGLSGLPVALPAKLVASLWPTDDEDESAESKLNRLADFMAKSIGGGESLSMAIRKGPLSAITGADMGRKMGLQDLIVANSGQLFEDLKPHESLGTHIAKVLVPSLGFFDRMQRGFDSVSNGDFLKGVATLLPRNIISDILLANRASEEGMTSADRKSKISPHEYTGLELFDKAIGLPPLLETLRWEAQDVTTALEKPKLDRREALLDKWVIASKKRDPAEREEAKAEAQKDIEAFNTGLSEEFAKYKIQGKDKTHRLIGNRKAEKDLNPAGMKETKRNKPWLNKRTEIYKPLGRAAGE